MRIQPEHTRFPYFRQHLWQYPGAAARHQRNPAAPYNTIVLFEIKPAFTKFRVLFFHVNTYYSLEPGFHCQRNAIAPVRSGFYEYPVFVFIFREQVAVRVHAHYELRFSILRISGRLFSLAAHRRFINILRVNTGARYSPVSVMQKLNPFAL